MLTEGHTVSQVYVLRLPPGEDLLVGLHRVCRENEIRFAVFQVTGALRNATLGHLDQGTPWARQNRASMCSTAWCGARTSPSA